MPPSSSKLDVNVIVSVDKRFIKDSEVKNILQMKYDWTAETKLCFRGKTIDRSEANGKVMYTVVLDEVSALPIKLSQGCLKYIGPIAESRVATAATAVGFNVPVVEDVLEDAVEEHESEEEIDFTEQSGWKEQEVFTDARRSGMADGFVSEKARLNMPNMRNSSPLDYFLFFLPMDHFHVIINNINTHARSLGHWRDVTFAEYLLWIALLTVMTVIHHSDKEAYWKQGASHFFMNIDFSKYMSLHRFNLIMKMHVFELPSINKRQADPLYQIRRTIDAFNDHMKDCVMPGKYLVIDESMNQWLGVGMPNLKKVPRKPHPIGQEFKTLACYHSYCILRIDTVSDPCNKEYDTDPGMKKLTATVKRLVKPWFGTARTVIADSWFGSPDMTTMLLRNGLYSIMQVTKRRYWPRGMPTTDIVDSVGGDLGAHFTMINESERFFVCSFRDQKVKAFISSCSTTRITGERSFLGSQGEVVTIQRPEVVHEYETHKSTVDAANNLRDNLTSYHDVIKTERWEMRFFGFFLGLCEANAYSAYRAFASNGSTMKHSQFKDILAFTFLNYCNDMVRGDTEIDNDNVRVLRNDKSHVYTSMRSEDWSIKRVRKACASCRKAGKSGTRVEKSCSCSPDIPMCQGCHQIHLHNVWKRQLHLNNTL